MLENVTAAMTTSDPTISPWPQASSTRPSGSLGRALGLSGMLRVERGRKVQGAVGMYWLFVCLIAWLWT